MEKISTRQEEINMNTRSVQRTLLASAGLKALPVGVLTDIQGNTIIMICKINIDITYIQV